MNFLSLINPLAIVIEPGNTIEMMQGIFSSVVNSKIAAFASLAAMIAGILAAFVFLKIAHDYMQGQGMTFWSIARPLLILTCVCNFNALVVGPVHFVCNVFTDGVMAQTEFSAQQYVTDFGKSSGKLLVNNLKQAVTEAGKAGKEKLDSPYFTVDQGATGLRQFFQRANPTRSPVAKWISATISAFGKLAGETVNATLDTVEFFGLETILSTIFFFLYKLVIFGQQVYAYVYLIVLALLGPFAFAFAVLPSFGHGIQSWIARYIQIGLWVPVGQIVAFICYQIMSSCVTTGANFANGGGWITACATLVAILAILSVPKICSFIIDSTGTNGSAGQGAGAVKSAVSTGAKVAAMAA